MSKTQDDATPTPAPPPLFGPPDTPATLRAFAQLPAYEFDFDYRGHTIRTPLTRTASLANKTDALYDGSALADDFDSYMFPEAPSPYAATDPSSLPSDSTGTTHRSSASDTGSTSASSTGSPPTPAVDWAAVDSAQLYSANGKPLDASHLYTGYSTLVTLVFVPRTAVELCALVYAKLAHLLQQASARLVFITPWTPQQATTFLSRFERVTPFPGSVICDPHASLFSAFDLTRSPLRALFSTSRVSAPMRQGVRNAFSTVTYRAQNRDIASTSVSSKRLKVGAVVMPALRGYAKRPEIVYAAEESTSTGVGCYMDVLAACGVNEAFVPDIDVAQLYARFNSMRVTSLKARVADEKEANRLRAAANNNNKARGSRKADRRNGLKT